jgi:hypothetical protein
MFFHFIMILSTIGNLRVRTVTATSCDIIPINLGIGMTTQLVFDQEPRVTLYADKDHFLIQGTKEAPKSLAVIPLIRSNEIRSSVGPEKSSTSAITELVDTAFTTNLFVFFSHNQQFMFEFHFVAKKKADFAVHIKRGFSGKCDL